MTDIRDRKANLPILDLPPGPTQISDANSLSEISCNRPVQTYMSPWHRLGQPVCTNRWRAHSGAYTPPGDRSTPNEDAMARCPSDVVIRRLVTLQGGGVTTAWRHLAGGWARLELDLRCR